MGTFRLLAFCGLVTIFLLSLSIVTAEDKNQNVEKSGDKGTGADSSAVGEGQVDQSDEYDDDGENVSQGQIKDPRPCPRNQLFGRAACDRICNYNDKEKAMDYDSMGSKSTTCRESDEFDSTFCSCPDDPDGGLDLTICRKAGQEDEDEKGGLTSEEVSHCNSLCSLEDKTSYSCQVRVEWESVPVCACGGRVNLQLLETRERKKKWAKMVREKRAAANPTGPTRIDLENYLNNCVHQGQDLDKLLTDLSEVFKGLGKDVEELGNKLQKNKAQEKDG